MGLPLTASRLLSLFSLAGLVACRPASEAPAVSAGAKRAPASEQERAVETRPFSSAARPPREALFLLALDGRLLLRAFGVPGGAPFEQLLANDVQSPLYDPELELVWFSDGEQSLWVLDTRQLAPAPAPPVLIAGKLPEHAELRVVAGAEEGRVVAEAECGDVPAATLHWEQEPWIAGEDGQRVEVTEGRAWLERERQRPARAATPKRYFLPGAPRVALPEGRARCLDPSDCGRALPFGARGWQLVLAEEEPGDHCLHQSCLLHDPTTHQFATPSAASAWSAAEGVAAGACGPYRFNRDGSAYISGDAVCALGGVCQTFEGAVVGWLVPGETIGP